MHTPSLPIRRTFTVVVAVTAIVLGFTAIQVASAWTADAAPLVASPASAASIESKLADEQARSADLQDRLTTIMTQTDDMAAALQAAQDRIAADAAHAEQLTSDLATANDEAQDSSRPRSRRRLLPCGHGRSARSRRLPMRAARLRITTTTGKAADD